MPGDNDPAQLKAAVQTVKDSEFHFSEKNAGPDMGQKVAETLKNVFKDYDICVYSVSASGPFYWDAYDENGNFYGGKGFNIVITLKAGDDSAEIETAALFGVRGFGPMPS